MRRKRVLFSWTYALVFSQLLGSISWADVKSKQEALKEYEEQIKSQKTKLIKLKGREGSLLTDLHRFSQKVNQLSSEISHLEKQRSEIKKNILFTQTEISKLEREIRSKTENVENRLRDLYVWGRTPYLKLLLSSDSPAEFRRRQYLVRKWIDFDQKEMETFQTQVAELSKRKAELEDIRVARTRLLTKVSQRKKSLNVEKDERKQLLSMVQNQKDYYEKSIQELEEAAKNLQKLIETLKLSSQGQASLFEKMRGRLIVPVRGKIEKRFGAYRDGKINAKLWHKGVDVRAKAGTAIRAIFDGKVVYADWFVGYGKILILDHGGSYFSLYAHVSDWLKNIGDRVVAGEEIANVGDSGSLKGPYLYFELRHEGVTVDPLPWFARNAFQP